MSVIGSKTTGTVTVTNAVAIYGETAEIISALVTPATKVIVSDATVIITDPDATAILASKLSAIDRVTKGTVTVTNKLAIHGTTAEVIAALVTAGTLEVANGSTVTITDIPTISELNTITTKTTGIVTATLAANSVANLAALTTDASDQITITVNDSDGTAITANQLSTIGSKTAGTVSITNAVEISGDHDQLIAALVTPVTKVIVSDANVKINDKAGTSINASELVSISAATTGTVIVNNSVEITGNHNELISALYTSNSKVFYID